MRCQLRTPYVPFEVFALLIPQMYGPPFANILIQELAAAQRADIATAWVRASGVGLLWPALNTFLDRGGRLRAVVGIDRDNTSQEGLELLLGLPGDVKVWVRHNEYGPLFHPKMYAFRGSEECRVLVGSNNLTGAGLSSNEELSVLIAEPRKAALEKSLISYMGILRAHDDPLVKRLDQELLDRLLAGGYVHAEARLKSKAAEDSKNKRSGKAIFGGKAAKRQRLPKALPLSAPIDERPTVPSADWRRVFIKLRVARGTQGQIPIPVAREIRRRLGETVMDGPFFVIDRRTRTERQISPTFPKRRPEVANTYKIEVINPQEHAILRLELIGNKVLAEISDSGDADGRVMYDFILDGLTSAPPRTVSSGAINADVDRDQLEADTDTMTLYRFD